MDRQTLEQVSAWAQKRVDSGKEPPWTFSSLQTLAEIAGELAEGMPKTAASQMACAPSQTGRVQDDPQSAGQVVTLDTFRSRRASGHPVRLPT